ncbi:MAG: hypothetical protein M1837_001855 [Sclerophora amabilis]|nr:MAG: hypothetical protein M1837_001855 [Sclerophora amabilis]
MSVDRPPTSTEPETGLETLRPRTRAVRNGDAYEISGQKIWISSAKGATKTVLLARTTPPEEVKKASEGLSLFFIDFDKTAPGLSLRRIKEIGGKAIDANEVFFDRYRVSSESLIGEEGGGFKMILHGMNAERCLFAGEALGLGYAALGKGNLKIRPREESAKLATYHAARLYDQSQEDKSITLYAVGVACNTAKYLAAEAAFATCERAASTSSSRELTIQTKC